MTVTASAFIALAIAHSALGERLVIRPLLASDWRIRLPRPAADRLLRFAWHLTSLTWLGLALILLDAPLVWAMALAAAIPAIAIFVVMRAHLAWPLFLLAFLAALRSQGLLPDELLRAGGYATAGVLALTAAIHLYWGVGGKALHARALPTSDQGDPVFRPGRWLTLLVALALLCFGALVTLAARAAATPLVRWLLVGGVVVLVLRAVGDRRYVGFTKTLRGTAFALADDAYYTPLVVLLAFGAIGTLLAG